MRRACYWPTKDRFLIIGFSGPENFLAVLTVRQGTGAGRQEEGLPRRTRVGMAVKADSLEDLYASLAPQHFRPGWNKPTPSL